MMRVVPVQDEDEGEELQLAMVDITPQGDTADIRWSAHSDEHMATVCSALSCALQTLAGQTSLIHTALGETADRLDTGDATTQDVAFLRAIADTAERGLRTTRAVGT